MIHADMARNIYSSGKILEEIDNRLSELIIESAKKGECKIDYCICFSSDSLNTILLDGVKSLLLESEYTLQISNPPLTPGYKLTISWS